MESRAKLAGHPIHPMLVVFPLGLLTTALIFDVVYLLTGNAAFATVAFWNISAGIVGGLLAAVFGFWDWRFIPANTRAKHIGLWHAGLNVAVIVLFAGSWVLRSREPGNLTTMPAFGLAVVAILIAAVSGWLGGELVDRLGIGVDRGAHPDAPNSLTGQPATQDVRTGRRTSEVRG